jgi:hypothetical protein
MNPNPKIKFRCAPMLAALSLLLLAATTLPAAVVVHQTGKVIVLANEKVSLALDLERRKFSVTDSATKEVVLADAWMTADGWGRNRRSGKPDGWKGWEVGHTVENVADAFGAGRSVVISLSHPQRPATATYLFRYTLYETNGAIFLGFGLKNSRDFDLRLMDATPLFGANLFSGKSVEKVLTLNGSAGAEKAAVQPGTDRESANSLMLTCLKAGSRRTVVWGGLANQDFGKWAAVRQGALEFTAKDPVGRLVDAGQTYWAEDSFYLDVTTPDPFLALEQYGRAMRLANRANPNVYDFPVLCGWSVGALSKLPGVNNSQKLIGELEAAQRAGVTKYTMVGIRLEPDFYCYRDGNTEQGWWDDAHWAQFGHLVPPYETFAKWCAAIRERDGVPYTYFQVGLPSDDYARAFPGHMLFNDISRLQVFHPHQQPLVSYDYTDPDFQKHLRAVWARLRRDGIRGIKFDYPETGWRPEGGFENRHATTAFAYREVFRLCREGLGADAFIDERNLGASGRPCLDITAGIVDTQRNWTDSNKFVPAMISIGGLRWYKNRTVFNYFPDTKTVHGCSREIRQAMLTMVFLTSGRIDLATSFTLFTPEIVRDFSRIYPAYREPFTARPLDAFTGVTDPQVYDLELTPDWHQVAVFNTSTQAGPVTVSLSGDRVTAGAIGLDAAASYYVYDFWSDTLVGKFPGTAKVEQNLGPSHCAMLSIRKVQANPQVLSTDRHVLQGWVDLAEVKWDTTSRKLSGMAQVIGGEPFHITLAGNGSKPLRAAAGDAQARLVNHSAGTGFAQLVIERKTTGTVPWSVEFD